MSGGIGSLMVCDIVYLPSIYPISYSPFYIKILVNE